MIVHVKMETKDRFLDFGAEGKNVNGFVMVSMSLDWYFFYFWRGEGRAGKFVFVRLILNECWDIFLFQTETTRVTTVKSTHTRNSLVQQIQKTIHRNTRWPEKVLVHATRSSLLQHI